MITRDYKCEKCKDIEVKQRITDPILEKCPFCGSSVKRVFEPTSFYFCSAMDRTMSKERK